MKPKRVWDTKAFVRAYAAGSTIREISAQTGVPRETLRLGLLSEGVSMRHRPIVYGPPRNRLDAEVALLLGLHAGDGWASQEWGLAINKNDEDLIRAAIQLARNVLGVEPFVSQKGDRSVSIRSGQPQVVKFFVTYGFPTGKKARTVSVPKAILNSANPEIATSFLKGLFSADGCFSHSGPAASCVLSVSSAALRDGFVALAEKLGFAFHCYTYVHRTGKNRVPLNVATIGKRDEVFRWMESVGSLSDGHIVRFRAWKTLVRTRRNAFGL